MVNIKTVLVRKAEWLDELINNKQRRIESAPEGRLVIDSSKGNPQYYCVSDNGRQYISVKQHDLICALSQKDYDYRIIKAAGQEKALIKKILGKYPEKTVETVFADLRRERQKLVTPIVPTKEEMIRQFRAQAFEPHPIPVGDTGLETDRGEIVRTRAEYIIANEINRTDAEYHYEKPLFLKGWGTVYPDFTILNVRTGKMYYWEHLGRTNDLEYIHKNIRKIEAYVKNGYYPGEKLILTSETVDFETGEIRIDIPLIRQLVRQYCT